jgi:methionyl-tRNA synthetase
MTSALTYANGAMHLGHVRSTYIPADIYVRFLRAKGSDVKYVCGTDEHGTPIVIKAEKEGKTPKEIADRYYNIISKELSELGVSFDNFSQTSRKVHHETAQHFFTKINENGHIVEKDVKQLFCKGCNRFLPDRYVEGICSHCGSEARGDHCEGCGRHLSVSEIKDPRCASCGDTPELKETTHFFFKLSDFSDQLRGYLKNKEISSNARNYAKQWLDELNDWDITRDLDWGVKIPGTDKVTYVWFDAPIGYVSFTKEKFKDWKDYWDDRVVHFIGKDIIYHHVLFWPAMLLGTGEFKTPAAVQAGGFLTLEGQKMSTSRNHVVWIGDYLKSFPADYLRYFLISAAALDQDIDFSWQAFGEKINSELIGNYGNFINRVLTFCKSKFDGKVPELGGLDADDKQLIKKLQDSHIRVTKLLDEFNFIEALKEVMALSRAGNEYFQKKEPWKGGGENTIHIGVNLARSLALMAEPFMPFSSKELLKQINTNGDWNSAGELVLKAGHKIGEVKPIFRKIEDKEIKAQIDKLCGKTKQKTASCPAKQKSGSYKKMVKFEEFEKLDLRVAEVLDVQPHPDADKLYVLKIDLGDEQRQIVAGVKQFYKPEELKGKKIVVVANLEPAKIRGVESNGMLLAAGKDNALSVLTLDKDLENGSVVG